MARKKNSEELDQIEGCIKYLVGQLKTSEVQSNPKLREDIQGLLNDNYRKHFQLSTGQVRERSSNTSGSAQG